MPVQAKKINENLIFEVDPTEITVAADRPRQRKEMKKLPELVESIRKYGQIHPILIDRDKALVAGGRRLAACMLGGFKARVVYKDTVDPILLREMELEENVQREDLTPAEAVTATAELVELKQKLYGKPTQGREGGFTLDNAAELLGRSKASIIEDMQLAEAVKNFPNLSECKTKAEIKKAVKGMERVSQQIEALASYEEVIKRTDEFVLVNKDAHLWLAGLGAGTVDLFFTDPPYAINIHDVAMTMGGETGGSITTTGSNYDDSPDYVLPLLEKIAKESYRVTKDTGHAYLFCAPSWFWWLKEKMNAAGWLTWERPLIWIKRETGQNNQPEMWPSSAYEFILFARKTNSRLVLQGRPDWIQCDLVLPSERVHQAEKPVAVCKELISRVCLPGQYMVDCCMGSGAIIEAGFHMKVLSLGCEKGLPEYASAVARMTKLKEAK